MPVTYSWGSYCMAIIWTTDAGRLFRNASSMPDERGLETVHCHLSSGYAKELPAFVQPPVQTCEPYKYIVSFSERRLPTQLPLMHASAVFLSNAPGL